MRKLNWLVGAAITLAGCSSNAPVVETENVQSEGAALRFSYDFRGGGMFRVVTDDDGNVGVSVQAPIGSPAEELMKKASAGGSLVDIYAILSEGAVGVPEALRPLSVAYDAQMAKATAQTRVVRAIPERESSTDAVVNKSQSAFLNDWCNKTFVEGAARYKKHDCEWTNSYFDVIAFGLYPGDRGYVYNPSKYTVEIRVYFGDRNTLPPTLSWQPTLQPYTATWFSWGGSYSDGRVQVRTPPVGGGGSRPNAEIGVTVHWLSYVVK